MIAWLAVFAYAVAALALAWGFLCLREAIESADPYRSRGRPPAILGRIPLVVETDVAIAFRIRILRIGFLAWDPSPYTSGRLARVAAGGMPDARDALLFFEIRIPLDNRIELRAWEALLRVFLRVPV